MDSKNTKNNKILFVISSYQHYQNYITTGALKEIKDRVIFLAHPGLAKVDLGVPKDRVFFYSYPNDKNIWHRHVFNINTWQNRSKNIAFKLRILYFNRRQLRIYPVLSLPILSSIVKFVFLKKAEDKPLSELIQKINPSIILIPSHTFEGRTFEIIKIAKKVKIPSLMIAENWDTLANKTIFTFKPDYLGVWGQQHVEHAVSVREMPRERIFILGAPKFINYMKPESRLQPSPYPFRYILYVGISDPFDELSALKKIDEIIDKRKIDLKVVYRPAVFQHTRNCPDVFFEYDFKHIILDTPSRLYYKRTAKWSGGGGFNPVYWPDLSHYPKLLSNMEFAIGPLSTMALESSLFDKKVYGLAYDDHVHPLTLKYFFDNSLHLKGVDRLKNMRMITDFNDLEKIFSPSDELKRPVEPIDIDYFVAKEETAHYPTNLRKAVDTILAGWH